MTNIEAIAQVQHIWANAAGVVKLVCGVGNNAAWYVTLHAHSQLRCHRRYKHKVKQAFRAAMEAFHVYERNLIYASNHRMFCLADMEPQTRKRYGNITDRQYYEFWTGCGSDAYDKTQPLITSLQNKYRLILLNHGIREQNLVAWAMTAQAALDLAVTMYESAIKEICNYPGIRERAARVVFEQFSLKPVAEAWRRALTTLEPATVEVQPTKLETSNLDNGLNQLAEAWTNVSALFRSVMQSAEDYTEVFRTRGEQKKAMREISEIAVETEKEYITDGRNNKHSVTAYKDT